MAMNTQIKLMLLCLLTGTATARTNTSATHDYTMVSFSDRLTCTLLEVGTTSLTFSVEWSPNVGTLGKLDLIGRLYPETRGWSGLHELDLNPANRAGLVERSGGFDGWDSRFPKEIDLAQRKAVFEVQYAAIPWYHMEIVKADFLQKAIFSVNFSVSEEDWDSVYWGDYKDDDKASPVTITEAMVQDAEQGGVQVLKLSREKKSGMMNAELEVETQEAPNRLWLYVGIAFCALCAIFYFLRRK